jgi:hypothetical protein
VTRPDYDEEDVIPLGGVEDEDEYEPDLGPDERDMDLLDGTWEQRYYSGQQKSRDWNGILVGVALIALLAMVLPMLLVLIG